jgi:Protein of unknown function (DUF1688)
VSALAPDDRAATGLGDAAAAVAWLRTPEAVRERCHALLALGERGELPHFTVDTGRLDTAARYVAGVTRQNHPELDIPYHARWRHFAVGGLDRWGALAARLRDETPEEIARIRIDLATVSVLLDAGAGQAWRYTEPDTGMVLGRSEGLAVASLHAFAAGLFSGDPGRKLRADAAGLAAIDADALGRAFQVRPEGSPPGRSLPGLPGRAALMRNLGAALRRRPDLFGSGTPRIGNLFDHFRRDAGVAGLPARTILVTVLDALAPIWPGRLSIGGENLGDVWQHRAIAAGGLTARLVPFHKLPQWLTYSLVEILEEAGIPVTGLNALTGLAEYRNGGLFLDFEILRPRDPSLADTPLPVGHEAVVEWRALTVALLDRIAAPVRRILGRSEAEMPLARILEGGTWAAAREIARSRRPGGGPPLQVVSDGTVF